MNKKTKTNEMQLKKDWKLTIHSSTLKQEKKKDHVHLYQYQKLLNSIGGKKVQEMLDKAWNPSRDGTSFGYQNSSVVFWINNQFQEMYYQYYVIKSIMLNTSWTSRQRHFPRSQNGVVPLGLGGPPFKEGNLG